MRVLDLRRPRLRSLALSLSAVAVAAGLPLLGASCSSTSSEEPSPAEAGTSTYVSGGEGGGGSDGASDSGNPVVSPDAAPDAPVGTPAVRYVGRTRTTGAGVECGWSGCRAIARFQGTAASIAIGEVAGGSAFYDVLIDGALQPAAINPSTGAATFALASGLPDGVHTVEVVKRSEALDGTETFQGFTFPNGGVLLPPPPPAAHTVEFIGDSVTAGFGVVGTDPCLGAAGNTNANVSFAGVAAATLGVDATFIAYSGKGVTRNYDHTDNQLLADLFLMTTVVDGAATWPFASNPRDAVVIALGANDFNTDNGASPSQAAFQVKYGQLLSLVRSKYSSAYIFATYTPTMFEPGISKVRAAIPAAIAALADPKLFFIDTIPDATGADTTGCEYHPNVAYDAQVGAVVAAFIKLKTGW